MSFSSIYMLTRIRSRGRVGRKAVSSRLPFPSPPRPDGHNERTKMSDKKEISFFLPMVPPTITHQEKKVTVNPRTGRPSFYEPLELKAVRQLFLDSVVRYRPEIPFDGPLNLTTIWSWPASDVHPVGSFKTSKPDTDNLIKLLKDCMTKAKFWKDDAQVAFERTVKIYDEIPGIHISVSKL